MRWLLGLGNTPALLGFVSHLQVKVLNDSKTWGLRASLLAAPGIATRSKKLPKMFFVVSLPF